MTARAWDFQTPNGSKGYQTLEPVQQPDGAQMSKAASAAEQVDEMKIAMAKQKINALKSGVAAQDPKRDSVYGLCFVLPQVARSLDWPPSLVSKVVQAYVVLGVCWFMQFAFIAELARIETFRSRDCEYEYGNRTLLDTGPTDCEQKGYVRVATMTPPDYTHWHLCGSQQAGVPYMTRLLCLTLFVLYTSTELRDIWEMMWCILTVKTGCESWVSVNYNEASSVGTDMTESNSLDAELQFSVGAMSMPWKIINFITLIISKTVVLCLLTIYGTSFLFNESSRNDLILNAVAFCFIIDIDEMVFGACATQDIREKMDSLGSYTEHQDDIALPNTSDDEMFSDEDVTTGLPSARSLAAQNTAKTAAGFGAYLAEFSKSFMWPMLIIVFVVGFFEYYEGYCLVSNDDL